MMLCGKVSGGNLTQLKQRVPVSYMAAQRAETNLHPTVKIKSFAERGKCELLQTTKLMMQFHNGCGTLRDGVLTVICGFAPLGKMSGSLLSSLNSHQFLAPTHTPGWRDAP